VKLGIYPPGFSLFAAMARFVSLFFLCYTYFIFLIPIYKPTKRLSFWMSFTGLILFWDLVHVILIKLIAMSYPVLDKVPNLNFFALVRHQGYSFIILFTFFIAFFYFRDIYVRQREIQLLAAFKTEKIALESSFLKSQVNPHFLFNTLNNIYALSLKKSEQTPIIIERLESLLQYMLYECKAEVVRLADEFTFANSYIELEKLRHRAEQCIVTVNIQGDINNQNIAPLLLINFLENAFKHGTKTSFGNSWINMNVKVSQEQMHFNLENSKPLHITPGPVISEYKGGIGLKNVRRRLEILYPGKHELQITDMKDRFDVNLIVNF
jgi:two-component system LytT family sensor kinase